MDIAKRFPENPILRPSDLRPGIDGMEIVCLLNPGVFRLGGRTGLLLRVAERPRQEEGRISFPIYNDRDEIEVLSFDKDDSRLDASDPRVIKYNGQNYLTTLSYLRPVFSDDGVHFYEDADYRPIYGKGPLESFGIEDCRVATMDDGYFLTFTEVSPVAVGVGLIATRDFKTLERKGMIFPPHNKDCALFESTVGGKYYAFHRPSSPELGGNYIWLAESPDRLHWGNHRCIAVTREGRWDSARVGAGAAPSVPRRGGSRYTMEPTATTVTASGRCFSTSRILRKCLHGATSPSWNLRHPTKRRASSETSSSPTDSMWKGIRYTCITGRATKSSAGPPSPSVKFWPR